MLASLLLLVQGSSEPTYFAPPSGDLPARVVPGGVTILPNGRYLTPAGQRLWTGEDLWGLAISPDGETAVGIHMSAASSTEPSTGLTVYSNLSSGMPLRKSVPIKDVAPAGIFSRDGQRFIVSSGERGGIAIYETMEWTLVGEISANTEGFKDAYINDISLSKDGKYAYTVDVAHQLVVVFDLEARQVIGRSKAGRQPYACTLSSDGNSLFVANIGIFDYAVIPKPAPGQGSARGLSKPAFAFPSREPGSSASATTSTWSPKRAAMGIAGWSVFIRVSGRPACSTRAGTSNRPTMLAVDWSASDPMAHRFRRTT